MGSELGRRSTPVLFGHNPENYSCKANEPTGWESGENMNRYMDPVFCFADDRNPKEHGTWSALTSGVNPAPELYFAVA